MLNSKGHEVIKAHICFLTPALDSFGILNMSCVPLCLNFLIIKY